MMSNKDSKDRKLLIIGAGEYGRLVKDIASDSGRFDTVEFLDDLVDGVLGKVEDVQKFTDEITFAIVAIGDATLRKSIVSQLRSCGYAIATLVHPASVVSKTARIGEGCVVEPLAVIQSGAIVGDGCLICSGSVVGHDAILGEYCHVNIGALVPPRSKVAEKERIGVGKIHKGEN